MKKLVIAGNWKMNKTSEEAIAFVNEINAKELNYAGEIMIFAPTIFLNELNKVANTNITIGAQNIHQMERGAMTGETSIEMIKSVGINATLVGHSERRQFFNETDKVVNEKTLAALAAGLRTIVCVGETQEEREAGITNEVLKTQTVKAFENVAIEDMANVIVAYEPVWAIGTGLVASNEDANEACKYTRSVIAELYNEEVANNLVIQYGGSVNPGNVKELMGQSDIDGALVGGASLEVESFVNLLV